MTMLEVFNSEFELENSHSAHLATIKRPVDKNSLLRPPRKALNGERTAAAEEIQHPKR